MCNLLLSIHVEALFRCPSHARDNKLHVWTRVEELSPSARVGSVAQSVGEQTLPNLCYSMDVNALNYCRFSLLPNTSVEAQALIALPNLVDSTSVRLAVSLSMRAILLIPAPGRHLGPAIVRAPTCSSWTGGKGITIQF